MSRRCGSATDFPSALWLRTVWATYAVSALVLARIDAITPGALLLVAVIAIGSELLVHGGERPLRLGIWLGAAFLINRDALRLALVYLYAGILVPVLLWWRLGGLRFVVTALTPWASVVTLLGAVGIAQFVAVHVESRLLAPFAFLHVVGGLALFLGARTSPGAATPTGAKGPRKRRRDGEASTASPKRTPAATAGTGSSPRAAMWGDLLSWIPVALVLVLLGMSLRGEAIDGEATAAYRDEILTTSSRASNGFFQRNVVVVGEAFPLLAHARALRVRLVAQVLPPSAAALDRIDPLARQQVLLQVLQESAGPASAVAWQLRPDGRVLVTRLR